MMMEHEINQYLAEQREQVTMEQREHIEHERHRDRMRRRDRDRDRKRRDRGGQRQDRGDRDRERSRDRYEPRDADPDYGYGNFNGYDSPMSRSSSNFDKPYGSGGSYDGDNYSNFSNDSNFSRDLPPRDFDNRDSRDGRDSRDSRDREGRDRDSRDSRDRDRDRDRDMRGEVREEKGGERWMTANPTNTVLLRGLPQQVDEKDIRAELMLFGAPIKEVRLMKRKDTGVSRGFAFVEFQNVSDAQRWMEHNQGQLVMLNQYSVSMYYSTPKTGPGAPPGVETQRGSQDSWSRSDWICNKCGVHNFRRRDFCFKCNISKEDSERAKEGDGFDQVGTNPCNTLIFRGLDALTTEENIVAAIGQVTTHTVKAIKVIRDDLTGTSRSFGFAEMSSIQDSTELLEAIQGLKHPFEVDGKAIMVAYAKNTFTTTMATMNQAQFPAGQTGTWDATTGTYEYTQYTGTQTTGYFDQNGQFFEQNGQYYDGQTYDYAAYYGQDLQAAAVAAAAAATAAGQTDTTNAAAAVAQAAIQQAQAAKQYQKHHEAMQKQIVAQMQHQQKLADMTPEQRLAHEAQEWSSQTDTPTPTVTAPATTVAPPAPVVTSPPTPALSATDYSKYPVPDVSTYQFDESSGYYYDPQTGLYYDANSQYYYNSTTSQFMYWDGEKQTYLPAPTEVGESANNGDNKTEGEPKKIKEKEKKEKVKVAKKIAKDMEKWAKTLNAQKEALKEGFKKSFQPLTGGMPQMMENKESATADAGFAILEKRALTDRKPTLDVFKKDDSKKLMPPPPPLGGKPGDVPGLVASYGGDSDDDDDEDGLSGGPMDEAKLVDLSKMACLLCKRQFPNKDALTRHTQLSDLHKKNLEDLRKKSMAAGGGQSIQYRDRAKERRQKYGVPAPPVPKKRQVFETSEPFEQPTKEGIGNDNIGNKLLQKMGWSKGQGLGKANQGITDPIQAMQRQQSAGLGARGSNYQVAPGDSYKETVKKVMFARYQELE